MNKVVCAKYGRDVRAFRVMAKNDWLAELFQVDIEKIAKKLNVDSQDIYNNYDIKYRDHWEKTTDKILSENNLNLDHYVFCASEKWFNNEVI